MTHPTTTIQTVFHSRRLDYAKSWLDSYYELLATPSLSNFKDTSRSASKDITLPFLLFNFQVFPRPSFIFYFCPVSRIFWLLSTVSPLSSAPCSFVLKIVSPAALWSLYLPPPPLPTPQVLRILCFPLFRFASSL